ncbi:hypothetical protein S-MbCM7_058 [Synechococcus phage ACG-2014h]|uniref:Uncharacterized protein n=1 Tax=Synechococcus phage ACG-2014h TaxID=1340810 RepID=V5USH8_9CAUD|nr:hypothetical protein S-MbCM7_058 [Synechococcus phage ACG-2014h]AHB80472.1 hypothetical protein S-MbCM7_058 [Synechococcus phage ACG-2014h]
MNLSLQEINQILQALSAANSDKTLIRKFKDYKLRLQ